MTTAQVLTINENSRLGYRQSLARIFLTEQPGTDAASSKYIYYVETDSVSGNRVYLIHPANLNKGFDFTIHAENQVFIHTNKSNRTRRDDIPSHKNIVDDLLAKKAEDITMFIQLKPLLDKVYQCVSVADDEYAPFQFSSGMSVELLFKVIKWLFVEQDITYWNWTGRAMLYNHLITFWE